MHGRGRRYVVGRTTQSRMPASPSATAERIKDANVRYHDAAAAELRLQVGDRLRRRSARSRCGRSSPRRWAAGPASPFGDALEIGAGHRLLLAQPAAARADRAADRNRHLARDARRAGGHRRAPGARAWRPSTTDAERLPFDDESFDLVFGHAVLHHLPDLEPRSPSSAGCCAPAARSRSAASPRATATCSPRVPKRGAQVVAPLWRPLRRRPGAPRGPEPSDQDGHELEPEVDVHAFAPRDLGGLLRDAGFERRPDPRRGAAGQRLRLDGAHARGDRRARRGPRRAGASFAFRSYLALQRVDAALLEPRLPAVSSSTTWCSRRARPG